MQRRRKSYWYFWRYDILVQEGFTPEEASIIANCKISAYGTRLLRRQRNAMVRNTQAAGLSRENAIDYVRASVRQSGDEIVDWQMFRRILYPDRRVFSQ